MAASPAAVFARLSDPNPPTPASSSALLDTAVVLGGSVAGLLAARVLSDHARTVLIMEVDEPGDSSEPRPGLPQGSQIHMLLPGGMNQMERWFPGFADEALAHGAEPLPVFAANAYLDGVRKVVGSTEPTITCSRPFLEAQIRRRAVALPNVKSITCRAVGLEYGDGAVTGVRYQSTGGQNVQQADLVVDAMGRSSRLSDWLGEAGWEKPALRRMRVELNYATAAVRRQPGDDGVFLASSQSSFAADDVGGAALRVEGDRWLMMLASYCDNRPGRTAEEFLQAVRTKLPPAFGWLADRGLLGKVETYRQADSRRRDFHTLTRMPARLVAVGDAVASFNPIYGQGMTCAALHASCLSEYLRNGPDLAVPAREFFELQRIVVDAAWDLSTGGDLALPHVDGPYPRGYRLQSLLTKQIIKAAVHDQVISRRFDEVSFMRAHPSTLARPGTLVRALYVNLLLRLRRLVSPPDRRRPPVTTTFDASHAVPPCRAGRQRCRWL
jgi:2-polyprenyl-6-methoxyphenol hydroxylase-like FAD-dependent oxidoreductase